MLAVESDSEVMPETLATVFAAESSEFDLMGLPLMGSLC